MKTRALQSKPGSQFVFMCTAVQDLKEGAPAQAQDITLDCQFKGMLSADKGKDRERDIYTKTKNGTKETAGSPRAGSRNLAARYPLVRSNRQTYDKQSGLLTSVDWQQGKKLLCHARKADPDPSSD